MGDSQPKIFVREATGLIRELGFRDQLLMSQLIINILGGFVLTAALAPFYFPGANLAFVFLLGAIPAAAMAVVYAGLSAAMPRSGGDYVWSARILGPLYGSIQFIFIFVGTILVGISLSAWSAVAIGLSQFFLGLGVAFNNQSWISLASSLGSASLGYPIDLLIVVLFTAVGLLGLRVYRWFQGVSMIIFYIATVAFIVTLVGINSATIPHTFDQAMKVAGSNATYNGIIQQASAQGFASSQFNWNNTILAAIPWGFLTFIAFNYGTYLAGETKNVKTSMSRALLLSVAITIVGLIIMAELYYNDFGAPFVNAASYVSATTPSALPSIPTASLFVSFVNPAVGALASFGLFLIAILGATADAIAMSRMLFAGSFDRLYPTKFADVNHRFHSPHWALILIGVVTGGYLTIYWNYGFAASLLNTSLIAPIGYLMPLLAAALFPIIKPDLFKRTAGAAGIRRSTMVIAGLIGVVAFGFYIFAETFPIIGGVFIGANLLVAYAFVGAMLLLGLLIYASARSRTKKLGIDMRTIYSEIPPE